MEGDVELSWSGTVVLTLLTISEPLQFLSVGVEDSIQLDEDEWIRFAFDLVGAYAGEGSYTIAPGVGAPTDASVQGSGDLTNTFLIHATRVDSTLPPEFDNLEIAEYRIARSGCDIQIGTDDLTGSLRCSQLETKTGRSIDIEWSWEVSD